MMLHRIETNRGTKRHSNESADENTQNEGDGELADEALSKAAGGTRLLNFSVTTDTQTPTGGDTATHEVGHWMGLYHG